MLGLHFCVRAFSSCGERGPLFIAVRGPLTVAASLIVEHRLQTHRLSSYGSRAQLLRAMWDLPRPGHEPVSPALAGRFSTTAPPGKPPVTFFNRLFRVRACVRACVCVCVCGQHSHTVKKAQSMQKRKSLHPTPVFQLLVPLPGGK